MKIVHICLSGLYMDGWGYQDNMLAKYHKKAGHDVYVIANEFMYDKEGNYVKIDGEKYIQPDTDVNGVKVVRLKLADANRMLSGPAERVRYVGLYECLKDMAPDVIFLHNPQIMDTDSIARFMKESKDTKLFVDSHSDYSNSGRNFLSKHFLHGMFWRSKVGKLIPYTKKFYGVLPARVDFILDRYKTPKDKTELLVMGMDDELAEKAADENVKAAIRSKFNVSEDDFLIVTGGKIDHAKRQTINLLDAVRNIGSKNIKLIVFGSIVDDMKADVLSKCDQIIDAENTEVSKESKIIYIGWLDADDTYPYFAAADLAVFPGRHSVMWEQVAGQGIPMIVKHWEGTTHVDLGGNTKFLYQDNTEELQKMIEELSDKGSAYQQMKAIAKDKGHKTFSYKEIARRCIE